MKTNNIFIMGDSYSTYKGYLPEGNHSYYGDNRKDEPIVHGVDKTWWKTLARMKGLNIVENDSYSGSTVCNTVRETLPLSSSFVNRMDRYSADDFFAKNEVGTMLIFGGTNDSWINAPIGEIKYSDWTEEDLKCVLPAFCYLVHSAKKAVEKVIVIINCDLKDEIMDGFAEICDKNGVKYVRLENVDKLHGHPTDLGMEQIAKQVAEVC